ncbi:hypothetical protein CMI47_13715 [Candidatus Pacearchaeota archaeon]|nr:hypothetical protein [Candidatus Pacearchaeota archaeon]|tara:strand:+ start:463 stop:1017 length:555 start_codon:yes stop_codon:yes gene_type:complete
MIWNEILCIGDSLTYGARDRYGRSYPAELAKIMAEKTNEFYVCHNYGINGETSSDLLRRTWSILKSNRDSKICLFMIGTNDTKKPTPLDVYEDNMRQIILSIKSNGMIPIVATLPELEFSPHYAKNRNWIDKYNKVITTLSKSLDFLICPMNNLSVHLIDGVHFTHEGYKEIAKKWSKKILSLK